MVSREAGAKSRKRICCVWGIIGLGKKESKGEDKLDGGMTEKEGKGNDDDKKELVCGKKEEVLVIFNHGSPLRAPTQLVSLSWLCIRWSQRGVHGCHLGRSGNGFIFEHKVDICVDIVRQGISLFGGGNLDGFFQPCLFTT